MNLLEIEKLINDQSKESQFVLRAHLIVEYLLEEIIQYTIKRSDILLDNNFNFPQKVSIAYSTGALEEKIATSLKNLNKVRNKFSHELHYKISEKDVDSIGIPLGDIYKKEKENNFELLEKATYSLIGYMYGIVFNLKDKK